LSLLNRSIGAVAPRSWTLQEPEVESCEYQDDANIRRQPLPDAISEEHKIYTDYDRRHRQDVKYDGYLSAH
jgi:hypothetical protein